MEKETSRVEAFSDGVFAIAITLLVLEIKVPHFPNGVSNQELWKALLALWPSFLAFVISFVAILIMWVNHHGLFNLIQRVDTKFMYANGFLLFWVTFVPFPTAVLAEHLNGEGAKSAAAFYCGLYIPLSLAFNLLWHTATKRRLVKASVSDRLIGKIAKAYRLAFPIYFAAAAVAFFSPFVGLAVCLASWVVWAVFRYDS